MQFQSDVPARSAALDGLRGYAAAAVIFYHAILHHEVLVGTVLLAPVQSLSGYDIPVKLALSLLNGNLAVLIFFTLSGFVLRLSLDRSVRAGDSTLVTAFNFVVRRLTRLLPALMLCLALYLGLAYLYQAAGWSGFPAPSIVSALLNAVALSITWHGPSSTIQAEIIAVPFVLVAFFISRALGLLGGLFCFIYAIVSYDIPSLAFGAPNFPGIWFVTFMAGMLAADVQLAPIFSIATSRGITGLLAASVLARIFVPFGAYGPMLGQAILIAAAIGSIYHTRSDAGIMRVLRSRWGQFLGRISYSLYLLNVLWLLVFWSAVDPFGVYPTHPLEVGLLVGTATLFATIPFAALSEFFIERGGIKLGNLLSIKATASSRHIVKNAPQMT